MHVSWLKSSCSVKCESVELVQRKKFHWHENQEDIVAIDTVDPNVNFNVKFEKIDELKFNDHQKRQNSDFPVAKVQKQLK